MNLFVLCLFDVDNDDDDDDDNDESLLVVGDDDEKGMFDLFKCSSAVTWPNVGLSMSDMRKDLIVDAC
jgi:hypothetical protein